MQAVTFSQLSDLELPGCPIFVCAGALAPDPQGRVRVVSGRGFSRTEARERCFAEGAERNLAVWNTDRPVVSAPVCAVAAAAIDPRQLVLLSEAQYARREAWNATVPQDHRWPAPISPDQPLDWVEAPSLSGGEPKLVPAAYCFLGYPDALEQGFPVPDSSGLAAGRDVCDAAERAALELVERDAVAVWWYNRVKRPPLDYDREQLHWIAAFESHISALGRRFWVLDLTHDLGVPVAAAISSDPGGRDLALGFGAGWTAEQAAAAAVGELVQFELSKRLQKTTGDHDLVSLARTRSLDDFGFFVPDPGAARAKPSRWMPKSIFHALAEQGHPAYYCDFSRHGCAAVRVIVPGLRPLWPRFAPGRLSDVPHRLGWTAAPQPEALYNPVPILY